ncbi:protein PELPK1-like [Syzygium oleosum]|uniref:protein PELPK1-like n=1 Tax=Syzygium oleosum TaxID=219896 RepID=UPI0011D2B0BA|nr:protein PELPK1-like [Syzygium oleosum]
MACYKKFMLFPLLLLTLSSTTGDGVGVLASRHLFDAGLRLAQDSRASQSLSYLPFPRPRVCPSRSYRHCQNLKSPTLLKPESPPLPKPEVPKAPEIPVVPELPKPALPTNP